VRKTTLLKDYKKGTALTGWKILPIFIGRFGRMAGIGKAKKARAIRSK
jgi:hypothetical protein